MPAQDGNPEEGKSGIFELFGESRQLSDVSLIDCARIGRLTIPGRKAMNTPNFFSVTSRGVVPHITPDVLLEHTDIRGVHMGIEDCKFTI